MEGNHYYHEDNIFSSKSLLEEAFGKTALVRKLFKISFAHLPIYSHLEALKLLDWSHCPNLGPAPTNRDLRLYPGDCIFQSFKRLLTKDH